MAVLAALVLLVGVARSGARYFYCAMMQASLATSCCAAHQSADEPDDAPALEPAECCEARHLASLPAGAPVASDLTLDAPLAFAPASPLLVVEARVVASASTTVRPGRGPPAPSRRRADLMIWTC